MKYAGSDEYIAGGLIGGNFKKDIMSKTTMTVYYLENAPLSKEEAITLRIEKGLFAIVQLKAENKLEGIQYPYFNIDEH